MPYPRLSQRRLTQVARSGVSETVYNLVTQTNARGYWGRRTTKRNKCPGANTHAEAHDVEGRRVLAAEGYPDDADGDKGEYDHCEDHVHRPKSDGQPGRQGPTNDGPARQSCQPQRFNRGVMTEGVHVVSHLEIEDVSEGRQGGKDWERPPLRVQDELENCRRISV